MKHCMKQCEPEADGGLRDSEDIYRLGLPMVGPFRSSPMTTMNKTVIQYRNKTISNYHDHTHDHIHLHGPGDWASLLIAVIVMVGFLIAVIAVVCLVSYKNVIILGTEKTKRGYKVGIQYQLLGLYVPFFFFFVIGAGVAVPQLATDCWGRIPEQFP